MNKLKTKVLMAMAVLLAGVQAHGQAYETAFMAADQKLNNGAGYSKSDNLNGLLAWAESYILMGYMAMYRATKDPEYLRKVITHSKDVIAQRDDNQGRKDYRGLSKATWVATKYSTGQEDPYAWVVHSGMITYPMADLAQLVIKTPALHGLRSAEGATLLSEANWLVGQVRKTIQAHDDQWDARIGTYRLRKVSFHRLSEQVLPYNMYAAMGRTLAMMYLATGDAAYLQKTKAMATHFRNSLSYVSAANAYTWKYNVDGRTEDASHAAVEVDFARLCYINGWVFSKTHMQRFANTFAKKIYSKPLVFNNFVDGSGGTNRYINQVGRFIHLSEYDKNIYHAVADVYLDQVVDARRPRLSGSVMLGVANCALYQGPLNPLATYRGLGSGSAFAGVAVGDFDGNGTEEIVAARNVDAHIYVYKVANGRFSSMAAATGFGAASDWAGVAAGDVDGDGKDEIIALRNFDARVYVMEYANGKLSTKGTLSSFGPASDWAGVAAGDFDGDGLDEFVAARNFDGRVYVMEWRNNAIRVKTSTNAFAANSAWAALAAGDFDGNGTDEFVAVRNLDAEFYLMALQGNAIVTKARTNAYGSASDWASIGAGDFDGDGVDEFAAFRRFDSNLFRFKTLTGNSKITSKGASYFPTNFKMGHVGAGKLAGANTGNDALVFIRDHDADFFVYQTPQGLFGRQGTKVVADVGSANEAAAVALFPNPVEGQLHLRLGNGRVPVRKVVFQDARGGKVAVPPALANSGNGEWRYDVGKLRPGLYFATIHYQGRQKTLRFIKR